MKTTSPYINDLCAELLGINAVNPFSQYNSSPRAVMFSSHFSQHLVIEGADTQRIQTGVGRELGKYTFSIKMPANGKILKVIEKFPLGVGFDSIEFNPTTTVIYENDETKEIDFFNIPYYASFHQFFGFKYDVKDTVSLITPGAYIAKDTIFADSPAVGKHGDYMFGINANVAFMSIPSVSEDGMMICRDFLPKLRFKVFETRVIEFGANKFPLNIYGNKDRYQPFPDIGEYVNTNGLLMMLRTYDDDLHPVEMSVMDTMEPDYIFDKGVYVRPGRGKVIDINVICNNGDNNNLPEAMCGFINKYYKANQKYHQEIISTEQKLRQDYRTKYNDGKLKLSPKLHRLIVESLAITNHDALTHKQNLNLMHRKGSLDEYRVEITVEYIIEPRKGFKLTDQHGKFL